MNGKIKPMTDSCKDLVNVDPPHQHFQDRYSLLHIDALGDNKINGTVIYTFYHLLISSC